MTSNDHLASLLDNFQTKYEEEKQFKVRFYDLLKEPHCFERKNLKRHFTGSCWVTDPDRKEVLLLHHAKLQRWLQPGGHADGEKNLIKVAQKELAEETGILHLQPVTEKLFDIDIHLIPERKNIPEHEHYDARFHFIADKDQLLKINEESTALQWVPIDQIISMTNGERSFERMVRKTNA